MTAAGVGILYGLALLRWPRLALFVALRDKPTVQRGLLIQAVVLVWFAWALLHSN